MIFSDEHTEPAGNPFAAGVSLDALAHVLGVERQSTPGKRLWYTLWLKRGPDVLESDASLRERTRSALTVETGADVSWWGRP